MFVLPKKIVLKGICIYQWCLSPFIGRNCRFYPSCSHYALQAVEKYGAFKGGWLSLKRVGRCHPWHKGGIDEIP